MQTQDVGIGRLLLKVGILDAIARVGERESRGVRTEFLDRLAQAERVARRLGHLFAVEHEVAVGTHRARPVVLGEERRVHVHAEGEVVRDEVLARRAQIHRVKVAELATKHLGLGLGHARVGRERSIAQDVVPHLVRQLVGLDANGAHLAAVRNAALEVVCNGVVGHVDGRVAQRFHQVLRIPRQLGAETVRARTRPLLEPVDGALEGVAHLGAVGVHLRDQLARLRLPRLLAVVHVPLVAQRHDALVRTRLMILPSGSA